MREKETFSQTIWSVVLNWTWSIWGKSDSSMRNLVKSNLFSIHVLFSLLQLWAAVTKGMQTPQEWIMLTILWDKMLMRQRYKIVGESHVPNQLTRKQWNDPKSRYSASHLSIMIILLSITREFTRLRLKKLALNLFTILAFFWFKFYMFWHYL